MNKLKQLQEKLAKAQADLGEVFKQAGDNLDFSKVTAIAGTDEEKCAAVRKMNDDCAAIQKEIEPLLSVEKARKEYMERNNIAPVTHPEPEQKSEEKEVSLRFGDAFLKAGAHLKDNRGKELKLHEGVNLKTLFSTSAGWAPENLRSGRFVEDAQRPIQVIDMIPGGRTSQAAVVYMEETTFTNNAAEATEGTGSYGEAALALTEQSSTVRKVAVFIPVTDEQLEDVAQVQSYLDNRLRFMLMQRLDSQIINGDGIAPNLQGILTVSGIQTQAKGSDLIPDAVYKAMTNVRVTGRAIPSGIIMHPTDWQSVRLLKTNDGVYIWGSPSEVGPERMWGLPVAQADSLSQGTAIVGAFREHIELTERRGITVKVSDSHDTYFVLGKQAIRADVRVALPIYRPAAFCKVTGL